MFAKQELSPYVLALFRRVKAALPPQIAERLRSNHSFTTHGSYLTLFLFDVWDCNQTDILNRQHVKYCLGHDGRPGAKRDGYFHLWLNKVRIYRERESIIANLEREVPRLVPDGFIYHPNDRAFNVGCGFDYPRDLSQLPDLLLPHYVALISAYHHLLMPIIDQFTTALAPGERRVVVAERGRLPFTLPGVRDRKRVREYTRSIPPSWRPVILERHDYRCANPTCNADLHLVGHHIDHIIPFSKGGTTKLENLQALCGPCNLTKGNREASTSIVPSSELAPKAVVH